MAVKYSQKSRMQKADKFTNIIPFTMESANDKSVNKWGFTMTDEVGKRFAAIESHGAVLANEITHIKETNAHTSKRVDDLHTKFDATEKKAAENHLDLKTQLAKQGFINSLIIWIGSMLATVAVQVGLNSVKKLF